MTEIKTVVDLAYLTRHPLSAYQLAHMLARTPAELSEAFFDLMPQRLDFWPVGGLEAKSTSKARFRPAKMDKSLASYYAYRLTDDQGDTLIFWRDSDNGRISSRLAREDGTFLEQATQQRALEATGIRPWYVSKDASLCLSGSSFMPLGMDAKGGIMLPSHYSYHNIFINMGWMPDMLSAPREEITYHDRLNGSFVSLLSRGGGFWVFESAKNTHRSAVLATHYMQDQPPWQTHIMFSDPQWVTGILLTRIPLRTLDLHPFFSPFEI